jgi:D-alanyl-D-alanine carboxypeptidase
MACPKLNPLIAAVLAVLAVCSGCRSSSVTTPLERGISTRLQKWFATTKPTLQPSLFSSETDRELQLSLERYAKTAKLPGAVVAVSSSQQIWMGATGQADVEKQIAMQPTDRFRIGKLSEMFIAVACLQLQEEGVLDLNDRITAWLPSDIHQRIAQSDWITVRQLLNHTSGLPDLDLDQFQQTVAADPSHRWRATELLDFMLDRQPAAPRGTFSYSRANYLLLQLIVERATGSSLAEALHNRIIKPLALKNTFVEFSSKQPFASGYQDWNQDGSAEKVTEPLLNTGMGLGSNALISNASDLTRFLQALFFDDTLLNSSSREKMLDLVETNGGGYGLGISHTMTRWGEVWGLVSDTTGFSAAAFYLPIHDLIMVTWTNSGDQKTSRPIELAETSLELILQNPYQFSSRSGKRW